MDIHNKQFSQEHLKECNNIKQLSREKFNLSPINNICLILEKIKETSYLEGEYVECGTYRGNTLFPVALFSSLHNLFTDKKLIGIDTFEGFPITKHNEKDLPSYFKVLYDQNLITKDHYQKAKLRTNDFKDISHLKHEYFLDVSEVFNNCNKFNNISLLKGTFEEITSNFPYKISVLHLDGDLYESYLTCLNNLYDNVIEGGVIIFDEYYSHKYPGARVAINEFFKNKDNQGYFEKYITEEQHERWCFVKKIQLNKKFI